MQNHLRPFALTLVLAIPLALPASNVRGADEGTPRWSPKAAAEYLDGRADWWLHWPGSARGQGTHCLSCHTAMPIALARPALGGLLGETTPGAVERQAIDGVKKRVEGWDKIVADADSDKDPFVPFYLKERKPSALGTESVVNALVLVNHDHRRGNGGGLSGPTRKALGHLWEQQQASGAWLWLDFGLNPWEKDGAYYGASLAAVAVGTAGRDYYGAAEVQAKVASLTKYLRTQGADQPLHHRMVGLWASTRLPGILDDPGRKKLVEEILAVQEPDGGWALAKLGKKASQAGDWLSRGADPEGATSDGYATGLAVLVLKRAGVSPDSPALQKGVAWLVSRQKDGAWPVSYLNSKRDPQDNIGKFMRDAGTAFAVLALTEPAGAGPADRGGRK